MPSRIFVGSVPAPDVTPPTAPGTPDVSAISALGSATVTVSAATDAVGVAGYDAFIDGSPVAAARSTTTTIQLSGLSPGAHSVIVRAFDAASNYSAASSPTAFVVPETTAAAPGPEPAPGAANVTQLQLNNAVLASLTNPEYGTYRLEGGTLTLYADTGDRWRIVVSEAITEIVVGLIPAGTGEAWIGSIELVQDATGHAVAGWPSGIVWSGGYPAQVSARPNAVTRVGLSAFDGVLGVGWVSGARPVRYSSFAAVTAPADTAENALVSIPFPALDPNDNGEFSFALSLSGTGNKTYRFKFGSTTVINFSDATATLITMTVVFGNRASLTAQWWDALGKAGTNVIASGQTSAEDTSTPKTFALTVQKVTGADLVRLERYSLDIRKD